MNSQNYYAYRNDDIVLRERIGNGNFGEVYKGILNTTGQDVAIKTCKINLPEDQKKKFLQEGSILKQYNQWVVTWKKEILFLQWVLNVKVSASYE